MATGGRGLDVHCDRGSHRLPEARLGRLLKTSLLGIAQKAGAAAVQSIIAFDNDAMIELNVSLGAELVRDPRAPRSYLIAAIKLR